MITQNASKITKDSTTNKIQIFHQVKSDKYAKTYHKNIIQTSLNNQNGLNSTIVNTKLIQVIIRLRFNKNIK